MISFHTANNSTGELVPPKGRVVRSNWARKLVSFLMVLGPGLIVMVADNDAGAVSAYTQAGAQYGCHLLWLMILLLPCTYFVQEMVARLGIATGEGHAALIHKRFGKIWGRLSLIDLLILNFLTLVTEFAAISLAMSQMGISPYIAVPLAAVGLTLMVSAASFRSWERASICLCVLNLAWLALAARILPTLGLDIRQSVLPNMPPGGITPSFIFLAVAIVGTTIAPWQLFFQQSCVADKKLRFQDLVWSRLDTFLGACCTVIMAGCMMFAGAALYKAGIHYADPAQMAVVLGQFYGPLAKNACLFLMCNAAILGAAAISRSSSWAYGEAIGSPASLEHSIKDAPRFYACYMLSVSLAAGIVLIPGAPLQLIIVGVQVLAGVMLPSCLIFLQLLLNDRELLGDEFVNRPWNNYVNWTIIALLLTLSLILAAQAAVPNLFPR